LGYAHRSQRHNRLTPALALSAVSGSSQRRRQADIVTEWNEIADNVANSTPAAGPAAQERVMAMVQIAVHDALNSIDARYAS